MTRRATLAWRVGAAGLVSAACRDAIVDPLTAPPSVAAVAMRPNPLNALSVTLTCAIDHADSARVTYWSDPGVVETTPYVSISAGTTTMTVLGLLPSTAYQFAISAMGPGGVVTSDTLPFATADLPATLRDLQLTITGTSPPGYLVTEVTHDSAAYVVAFDSAARVRWYRRFAIHPDEAAMETKQLANGDFTVYVGASTGWQPVNGRYIEFRPSGEIVRVYLAGAPYYTDNHELLVSLSGDSVTASHLFGYDLRTVDLTALGGRADQLVAGHTLLRQSATGETEFLWNSWDHFTLADWVFVPPNLSLYPSIDFDHPNSLAIDRDGNYVVSFAMLGEIAKIDAVTGEMLWRFGGRHNQFTIVGDPLNGFGFQHDVHVLA